MGEDEIAIIRFTITITDALCEKKILQRKTEFIWCAIKIRTHCAVNVDRNPVSDRNSSQSARKPNSFYWYCQHGCRVNVHTSPRSPVLSVRQLFLPCVSSRANFILKLCTVGPSRHNGRGKGWVPACGLP